jgi:gamma-glutamyltranspeptidase/glutathione hydrolase
MHRLLTVVSVASLTFVALACTPAGRARAPTSTLGALPATGALAAAARSMVVTASPPASEVGRTVLAAGGNAMDAAVAIGFVLAVTLPGAGNVAGGGFMVLHFPDGRATTIDFRESAPLAATPDMFIDASGTYSPELHLNSYRSVGVPGIPTAPACCSAARRC